MDLNITVTRSPEWIAASDAAKVARAAAKAAIGTADFDRLNAEYLAAGAALGVFLDADYAANLSAAAMLNAR